MSKSFSNTKSIQQKALELYKTYPLSEWPSDLSNFWGNEKSSNWYVACSGGADSVFLLLLIYAAPPGLRRKSITVLHYNHQLRGEDSLKDHQFVEELSSKLELRFVSQSSKSLGKSDESSLRVQRREFFLDAMKESNDGILVQGHNLDDIAETFLWRIPRGVGIEGLCSPKPIEKFDKFLILRPLLNMSREKIRSRLKNIDVQWRDDCSNKSDRYLRNRLRMNTLISWKSDSDRDLLIGVKRTRNLINEQSDALNSLSMRALAESIDDENLVYKKLLEYPRAIIRKVLTLWIARHPSIQSVHQHSIDRILDFVDIGSDFKFDLSSNLSLNGLNNRIFLKKEVSRPNNWGFLSLPINTVIQLPTGMTLTAEVSELTSDQLDKIMNGFVDPGEECYLPLNSFRDGLNFRQRKSGDKYKPLGLQGTKKIKKSMIDHKWNQSRKDNTPIVIDNAERILWIPGFPPDQLTLIDKSKTKVIRLTYIRSKTL